MMMMMMTVTFGDKKRHFFGRDIRLKQYRAAKMHYRPRDRTASFTAAVIHGVFEWVTRRLNVWIILWECTFTLDSAAAVWTRELSAVFSLRVDVREWSSFVGAAFKRRMTQSPSGTARRSGREVRVHQPGWEIEGWNDHVKANTIDLIKDKEPCYAVKTTTLNGRQR